MACRDPCALHLRGGVKMGNFEMVDTMIKDGCGMPSTAITWAPPPRTSPSRVPDHPGAAGSNSPAVGSQNKAGGGAEAPAWFKDEIALVTGVEVAQAGDVVVDADEYPKHGTTLDQALAQAAPGLQQGRHRDGRQRVGHQLTGAAAVVALMKASEAAKENRKVLARIVSWAHAGVDPAIMGTGPIPASRAALKKAGWSIGDLDLIEANEAFAAQACAVNKDLGWDTGKVNVNGGAIALGHPIGASGARVLVTLLHEMEKRNAKKGLATLCIGGGMGIAMCLERG